MHRRPSQAAFFLGLISIIGYITVIATDVFAGLVVNDYSMVRDTISDLAAGQRSWILDLGLQAFAIAIIACAIGLFIWNLDTLRWRIGCILLLAIGIDISVIASHNAYGDNIPTGVEIHIYLVVFLGIAFPLACWLLASGLEELNSILARVNVGYAAVWLVLAPLFFVLPTHIDGAYERFLAVMMITWFITVSGLLMYHNRPA